MNPIHNSLAPNLSARDELIAAQERAKWAHRCRIRAAEYEENDQHSTAHALHEMAREIAGNDSTERSEA